MIGKLGATIERAYPAPVRSKATGDAGAITANDIRQDQQRRTQADKGRTAVSLKLSVAEALVSLRGKSYIEAGKVFAKVNKAGLGDWEGQVTLHIRMRWTRADDRQSRLVTLHCSRVCVSLRRDLGRLFEKTS
jgi:hypothetical protein